MVGTVLFQSDALDWTEEEASEFGAAFLTLCSEMDYVPSGKGLAVFNCVATLFTLEAKKIQTLRAELKERKKPKIPQQAGQTSQGPQQPRMNSGFPGPVKPPPAGPVFDSGGG